MLDTTGMSPDVLLTPATADNRKLALNDGSWFNLQIKYKSLSLLPEITIQEVSDTFKQVRNHAMDFDHFMSNNILGMADDNELIAENLSGHLNTLKAYQNCTGGNCAFLRVAALNAIDSILNEYSAQFGKIDTAAATLKNLAATAVSQQTTIDNLSTTYDAKLASEDKEVLQMKSDLADKWNIVFADHDTFCDAFSNGIVDAALLVVHIGQAAGELATDETVSPDTVKDIIEKGIDLTKDTIRLFSAAAEAEKTMNEIHDLYPKLLAEMSLEYDENRAVVLLQYTQLNFKEIATVYQEGLANLVTVRAAWTKVQDAWTAWKNNFPATDAEASQYLADSNLDALNDQWAAFAQLSKDYAAVGNIVYTVQAQSSQV